MAMDDEDIPRVKWAPNPTDPSDPDFVDFGAVGGLAGLGKLLLYRKWRQAGARFETVARVDGAPKAVVDIHDGVAILADVRAGTPDVLRVVMGDFRALALDHDVVELELDGNATIGEGSLELATERALQGQPCIYLEYGFVPDLSNARGCVAGEDYTDADLDRDLRALRAIPVTVWPALESSYEWPNYSTLVTRGLSLGAALKESDRAVRQEVLSSIVAASSNYASASPQAAVLVHPLCRVLSAYSVMRAEISSTPPSRPAKRLRPSAPPNPNRTPPRPPRNTMPAAAAGGSRVASSAPAPWWDDFKALLEKHDSSHLLDEDK